jgi:hypothetical protein
MEPKTEQAPLPPRSGPRVWPFVLVLLLVAVGLGVWFVVAQPRGPVESVAVDAGTPVVAAPVDAGPALSLDDGDALLKKLAAPWSKEALYAKWLDALVLRQLVAATQLVAEGNSPRAAVPFISIAGSFAVREEEVPGSAPPPAKKKSKSKVPPPPREVRTFIATQSFARYDSIAAVFGSIDAAAAGEAWSKLEPFCDVAFGEISRPGTRFHDTLRTAFTKLLAVHVPEGEVELVPKGAVYAFKDPQLEALSAAQKHLVRMGAKNAQLVQAQLRQFAEHAKLELP